MFIRKTLSITCISKLNVSPIVIYCIYSFRLHGSYEALDGGQTMDALVDLTGGLAERYEIENKDPNLYRQILRASKTDAFITCSRKVNPIKTLSF